MSVACIGSCLIDTFLHLQNASKYCSVDQEEQLLCIRLGEKIPLDDVQFELGGNACNVSVGLSRLNIKSSLVAEIGTDEFSDKITSDLEQERVDTTHMLRVSGKTSVAFGIQVQGERTLFTEHVKRKHQFVLDDLSTQWVYLTSLGQEWHHVYKLVAEMVAKKNLTLVVNPGTLQLQDGVDGLREILKQTAILILNKDEALHLTGDHDANTTIDQLLYNMQKLGPKIVVITDGKNGAYAKESEQILHEPIFDAPIVEKTGAGDAFATGFLAARVSGQSVQTAMKWGSVNAASVIGHAGAQKGLLTKDALEEKVKTV